MNNNNFNLLINQISTIVLNIRKLHHELSNIILNSNFDLSKFTSLNQIPQFCSNIQNQLQNINSPSDCKINLETLKKRTTELYWHLQLLKEIIIYQQNHEFPHR